MIKFVLFKLMISSISGHIFLDAEQLRIETFLLYLCPERHDNELYASSIGTDNTNNTFLIERYSQNQHGIVEARTQQFR